MKRAARQPPRPPPGLDVTGDPAGPDRSSPAPPDSIRIPAARLRNDRSTSNLLRLQFVSWLMAAATAGVFIPAPYWLLLPSVSVSRKKKKHNDGDEFSYICKPRLKGKSCYVSAHNRTRVICMPTYPGLHVGALIRNQLCSDPDIFNSFVGVPNGQTCYDRPVADSS